MSFKLSSVQGTVTELETDLESPAMHDREEFVIEEVKKAINHIVTSLGGYLSVSCNGNINPVSGETGDIVDIHITSLPYPPSVESAQTQPEPALVETGEPVSVTEESKNELSQEEKENLAKEQKKVETESTMVQANLNDPENSAKTAEIIVPTIPQSEQENASENSLVAPAVEPITPGQAEALEIAQATPPNNTTDQTESSGVVTPEINTAA